MAQFEIAGHCPSVDPDAWIAESAQVVGNVEIGAGASIWPGAVLRGDLEKITVAAGSNIQDNAVLHTERGWPCTVEENVSVGHAAILHGCTVKKGALIGMGAVVLNGAVIEENAIVGAGSLVAEGKIVAAGTLVVGIPARTVRLLTPEEIAKTHRNTDYYVKEASVYRTRLKRID